MSTKNNCYGWCDFTQVITFTKNCWIRLTKLNFRMVCNKPKHRHPNIWVYLYLTENNTWLCDTSIMNIFSRCWYGSDPSRKWHGRRINRNMWYDFFLLKMRTIVDGWGSNILKQMLEVADCQTSKTYVSCDRCDTQCCHGYINCTFLQIFWKVFYWFFCRSLRNFLLSSKS